jgi:RimJ/RimL family protein N-acetyltransferase
MPDRFPQEVVLRDGRHVLLRPFTESDTDLLYEFFRRLPTEVRRTAWDNIEDRALIESWSRNIDYSKVFPLVAVNGHSIVADATLHRRERGPLRLVGRIKWLIDPVYRGQGLGTTLVNNLISIAREHGLRHLSCMPITNLEEDAIKTMVELGFDRFPVPGYGTDPDGNQYDMVKLVLRV